MASERRAARQLVPTPTANGIPTDLAAGPCIEVWADPDCRFPEWSAFRNWKDARDAWARAQGLNPSDYCHLPAELYDRALLTQERSVTTEAAQRRLLEAIADLREVSPSECTSRPVARELPIGLQMRISAQATQSGSYLQARSSSTSNQLLPNFGQVVLLLGDRLCNSRLRARRRRAQVCL